jgi:Arc/MetJ family transcription regulator
VTKILVDIDDEALERAAKVFGTKTKKDTVNTALREAARRIERAQALDRLGEMADQGDFDEFLGNKAAYRT